MVSQKYEWYSENDSANDNIYGAEWSCNTFTVGTTGTNENFTVDKVVVKVGIGAGNPGDVTMSIYATAAGKPTGAPLCSGVVDGSSFDGGWYSLDMSSHPQLNASTKYAIVISCATGAGNHIYWRFDQAGQTYGANGDYGTSEDSGSTWTMDSNGGGMFEIWGTSATVNITIEPAALAVSTDEPIINVRISANPLSLSDALVVKSVVIYGAEPHMDMAGTLKTRIVKTSYPFKSALVARITSQTGRSMQLLPTIKSHVPSFKRKGID